MSQRSQMKTQIERHENSNQTQIENSILRQENDKLRSENISIRDAMRNLVCSRCESSAMLGEVSLKEQHLRIENARLKDELDCVCALAGKFLGRPLSSLASPIPPISSLELAIRNNGGGYAALANVDPTLPAVPDFSSSPLGSVVTPSARGMGSSIERSMFLELVLAAIDKLVKMAQLEEPLWLPSSEGGREVLNYKVYNRSFRRCIGMKPASYISEATKAKESRRPLGRETY